MGDKEGTVELSGGEVGEVGVDGKAKVDVYLDCLVFGLKDSSLICLPSCSLTHVRSTVNSDIFVEQPWST